MTKSGTSLLFFGGDVYLGERHVSASPQIQELLGKGALTCVNLEGPTLDKKGLCDSQQDTPLYSNPQALDLLKQMKVSAVTLANNHITDWNLEGLDETLDRLKQAGIQAFGAGRRLSEATKPLVLAVPEGRVGLLSFGDEQILCVSAEQAGFGCAPMLSDQMRQSVESLASQVDIVVVQVHTGLTNYHAPVPSTRQLFRQLIDSGADVVIAHHPHVLQGFEEYCGKPIYYSLGNLVFAPILRHHGWMNLSTENCFSMLVELELRDGEIIAWRERHTRFDLASNTLELLDSAMQAKRQNRIRRWSSPLSRSVASYKRYYRRYVLSRTSKRLLWRLHPSRWNELSIRHVKAVFAAFKRI